MWILKILYLGVKGTKKIGSITFIFKSLTIWYIWLRTDICGRSINKSRDYKNIWDRAQSNGRREGTWEGPLGNLTDLDIVFFKILFINFRERKEWGRQTETKRERNRFLFHLFMHSLVASCMCPDQWSNPQTWCIRMTLYTTELARQGCCSIS